MHHSQGLLGAATFAESEYRRIKLLKEAGFNAVRSAHNPLSRAALEACDRLGMLVLDELWDMWFIPKNPHDYAKDWRDHYQDDIRQMVNKDYNHPAVIMYSIGNEVGEPATPEASR
ncbi:glycoside hydrolase family 2 TIM barrel-domain containing protein [Lacticaseibacillus nasuensis]|uniref:glycoside hydrolase family 2 TIM barrel-domain containing protein n=1 Tax=Lacticaseibacillus nasuensis TaxID=944671 RepID=UPI0021E96334|nr:glycoside hydrolase family 2 TIM barrel-domain containing protein [Lacticaseibacillus nasuensis]